MNNFNVWIWAIRPKTLPAAIAPVMIGTAMALQDGFLHVPSALAALAGAVLIQIGTNLANDYFDAQKGADAERIGPLRVTQAGLVSPGSMKAAITITFLLAIAVSWYLIVRGGWPIAIIGILSILSGIFYTAGPYPLGYLGLGEVFVFLFFGPVAVGGTYYVQAHEINPAVMAAGFAPGFLSAAILAVNNLRDIEGDRKANKLTLAVRFGRSFAMSEYLFCMFAASFIPVLVYILTQDYLPSLISVLVLFLAIPTIKTVLTKLDGPSLNHALARTGQLLLIYSLLFSIGWNL